MINKVPDSVTTAALHKLSPDAMLTRKQVSQVTGFAISTLRLWARLGKGPPMFRVEGHPRYRVSDVRTWMTGTPASTTPAVDIFG